MESSGDGSFDTFYMPCKTIKHKSAYAAAAGGTMTGTTVRFDDYEDLMWIGTKEGRLSSYVGPHLKLLTTFASPAATAGAIVDYCITQPGLLTVGWDRLRLYRRDGYELLNQPLYTVANGERLSCCLTVGSNTCHVMPNETVFVAGNKGWVAKVDLQRPEVVENVRVGNMDIALMRSSDRFMCFGSANGDLGILDVRTNQVRTHKLYSNNQQKMLLWDFDVHDYSCYLCATDINDDGTLRQGSSILAYDLRIGKATAPVTTAVWPRHVRVVPATCGQKCLVLDQKEGQYQLISSVASCWTEKNVCRVSKNCSVPLALEVSSTGQEVAVVDDTGSVHVLRSAASAKAGQTWDNAFGALPSMQVVDQHSLNQRYVQRAVGVAPGFADATVSTTPSASFLRDRRRSLRTHSLDFVAAASSSSASLERSTSDVDHLTSSRYPLSVEWQEGCSGDAGLLPPVLDCLPAYPQINGFLHCLYHLAPISTYFQSHLCFEEFCLSCELGFLFHMMAMEDSSDEACQTGNLLRCLRALPEACERGLIYSEGLALEDVGVALQTWVDFVMERTHVEYYSYSSMAEENPLTALLAWRMLETVHHSGCNHTSQLHKNLFAVPLQYHHQTNDDGSQVFCSLLKNSINEYSEWRLTCGCGLESTSCISRQVLSYPECLAFTFDLADADNVANFSQMLARARAATSKLDRELCRYGAACSRPNCFFLHPEEINSEAKEEDLKEIAASLWIRQGFDGQTEVLSVQPSDVENWLSYQLSSVIYHQYSTSSQDKEDGYYSYVKTQPWGQWCRFAKCAVTTTSQTEAVQFDLEGKVPCVVVYLRTGAEDRWPVCPVNPITREVFQKFSNVTACRRWYKAGEVLPVAETESFGPYNIVALDAEFVSLAGSENESVSEYGGQAAMLSVGRVTVVRGNGPLQDHLLMDEYVVARDKVANHLTKYSGIQPGDLNMDLSLKPLDTLKSVYVRLRYLVDAGVRFVGHGISTDFRILNLRVPQGQIIDTVQLYRLPGKRLISLRFLAWYFLRLHIQELNGHDSVEDAMASLSLYRWFEQKRNTLISWNDPLTDAYIQSVTFDELLHIMYHLGRSLDWKVSPKRP